jgi:hypothetical protein
MEQIDILTEKIKKKLNKKGGADIKYKSNHTEKHTYQDADHVPARETDRDPDSDIFLDEEYEINKTELPEIMSHLENWANENKFNYETLMKIVNMRDELLSDLLNLGLNPFYNSLGLRRGRYKLTNILKYNLSDGISEIRKIKNCIYEGYRLNLFIWNDIVKKYISNVYNYPISLDSKLIRPLKPENDIKQIRPQKIIVANIMLGSSNYVKGMYEFKGNDISVLDGYVNVDVNFVNN